MVGIVESPILGPEGNREFLLMPSVAERVGMTTATTGFAGSWPAHSLFAELQDHNDPAWFARKEHYETEVLAPFRDLIVAVGEHWVAGLPLTGDPRGISAFVGRPLSRQALYRRMPARC